MIDQLWLIPLGFIAGILGSMIGLGGGIIVVPVLTFLGFPPLLQQVIVFLQHLVILLHPLFHIQNKKELNILWD